MINKFKNIIKNQNRILEQSKEIEWAHVYHDSIRGIDYIEKLSLNIGRWAGNYSFFYILNRILKDFNPDAILEFGLGESSKFISSYLENSLINSKHVIIEQNIEWVNHFKSRFALSKNSEIIHCNLIKRKINNFSVYVYENLINRINEEFDLFIVDGPYGSDRFSRYDIVYLVEKFSSTKDFIILVDDSGRRGEIDTIESIKCILNNKNIKYYVENYIGNKQNTIIASEKYRYSTSL